MLLSPNGTSMLLGSGDQIGGSWNGQDGASLFNTVFDDEAIDLIYDGNVPFVGSFKPQQFYLSLMANQFLEIGN